MKRFIPELVSGYNISPVTGNFSIVVPEASTNLVLNPSPQENTTGYSAVSGATISRSNDQQRRWFYSIKVDTATALQGIQYTLTLQASTTYTFSVDVFGKPGIEYDLRVYQGATLYARKRFRSNRRWKRPYVTFVTGASPASYVLQVLQTSAANSDFYVDGYQLEAKPYPTTYLDGDMVGYVIGEKAYEWSGKRFASISVRSATTNSGGREHYLSEYDFHVTGYSGLGMPPVNNFMKDLVNGGAFYNGTIPTARPFTIVGSLFGNSIQQISKNRDRLVSLIKYNNTPYAQTLLMRYHPADEQLEGDVYNIRCVYQSGLEGAITNNHQEQLAIQFVQPEPIIEFERTYADYLDDYHTNINTRVGPGGILVRRFNGELVDLNTEIGGIVQALEYGSDGRLYFGGTFDQINGISGATPMWGLGVWDGANISRLGALNDGLAASRTVKKILALPNGRLLIIGSFSAGGAAHADATKANALMYNINTGAWENFGTPNGAVNDAIYLNGTIYVAGAFTNIGGSAISYLARTTNFGATFSSVGSTGGAVGHMVGWMSGSTPQIFLTVDTTQRVIFYNGTLFTVVRQLNVGDTFIDLAHVEYTSYVYVAARQGLVPEIDLVFKIDQNAAYEPILTTTGSGAGVQTIFCLGEGYHTLYIGTDQYVVTQGNAVDNMNIVPGMMNFVYGSHYSPGIFVMAGKVNCFKQKEITWRSEIAYAYYNVETTEIAPATAYDENGYIHHYHTVTNNSDDVTYPTIDVLGPCRLHFVINYTTDQYFRLDDVWIEEDETVRMSFGPGGQRVVSNYRGDITGLIYGAKSPNIRLAKGDNVFQIVTSGYKVLSGTMQATYLNLYGANDTNTDNGILYVTKTATAVPVPVQSFDFYSDVGKTNLVATVSDTNAGTNYRFILPNGNSGLTGFTKFTAVAAGNAIIKIARIKIFWKEAYLTLDGKAVNGSSC